MVTGVHACARRSEWSHVLGLRQHGMGAHNLGSEVVHSIVESGGAACERLRGIGSRLHGMGLCNGEDVG